MEMTTLTNRGDVLDCALSADGRYLAYLAGTPAQTSLHVRQVATGSDVEVVPATGAGIQFPAFSPDGNYLYYLMRKADAQNYRALYEVPSLGGAPRQRAFDVDSRVTFSPDGSQLAFWRGVTNRSEMHLVVIRLDSSSERTLGVVTNREFVTGSPAWSPDGKTIATALISGAGRAVSVVAMFDAASGARHDEATLSLTQLRDLAWLRDGSAVVATAFTRFSALVAQVLLIDTRGGSPQHVTNDLNEYRSISASSADDELAAVRMATVENVWVADAAGGPARPLTRILNAESSLYNVAVVDTGTIAFMAPHEGGTQVWTISASGGEPRPLTTGSMFGATPRRSGGRILFNRVGNTGLHVWSVQTDGSDLKQLTSGDGEQVTDATKDGRYALVQRFDSVGTWMLSMDGGKLARFAPGVTAAVGFSLDDKRVLLGTDRVVEGGLMRLLWQAFPVNGGPPTDSLMLPGQSTNPKWNASGTGILYQDTGEPVRNIWRQDFGARTPTQVTRFTEGRILTYLPSPDGRRFAVSRLAGGANNLWITDADGGHPVQVTQFTTEHVFEFSWLSDRRLAIGAGTQNSDAVLIRKFR
jgi:Tol biopolymer transport system component